MKLGKYLAAATITAAMLGVAQPAFANEAPEPVDQKESTVTVDIIDAPIGQEVFTLNSVPTNFLFESVSMEDGDYRMDNTTMDAEFRAFKNFLPRYDEEKEEYYNVYAVSAKVSSLTVNNDEQDAIDVTDFTINDKSIGSSTGEAMFLYGDTDFKTKVTESSDYAIAVNSAAIEFTRAGLSMEDTLSGSITYSVASLMNYD